VADHECELDLQKEEATRASKEWEKHSSAQKERVSLLEKDLELARAEVVKAHKELQSSKVRKIQHVASLYYCIELKCMGSRLNDRICFSHS
jgi:hypothetical protein